MKMRLMIVLFGVLIFGLLAISAHAQTLTTASGYPDIAGEWIEVSGYPSNGSPITITQSGAKIVAGGRYAIGTKEIAYRVDGTVTRDGVITGRLVHTEGVSRGSSGFAQDRRMTLSPYGNTIEIAAVSEGGGGAHQVRWRGATPIQSANKNVASPPTKPPGSAEVDLFNSMNIYGVGNSPTAAASFTLSQPHVITSIMTYHWNDGRGTRTGTIALRDANGETYGPWSGTGTPGQGGVPNANWTCAPNIEIPAGAYTIIDSEPATWSQNAQSGGRGMAVVKGYPTDSTLAPIATPSNPAASDVPGLVRSEDGKLHPANGYEWVNPKDPADLRVQLKPGLVEKEDGKLQPANGYKWVNPNDPNDLRVQLKPTPESDQTGGLPNLIPVTVKSGELTLRLPKEVMETQVFSIELAVPRAIADRVSYYKWSSTGNTLPPDGRTTDPRIKVEFPGGFTADRWGKHNTGRIDVSLYDAADKEIGGTGFNPAWVTVKSAHLAPGVTDGWTRQFGILERKEEISHGGGRGLYRSEGSFSSTWCQSDQNKSCPKTKEQLSQMMEKRLELAKRNAAPDPSSQAVKKVSRMAVPMGDLEGEIIYSTVEQFDGDYRRYCSFHVVGFGLKGTTSIEIDLQGRASGVKDNNIDDTAAVKAGCSARLSEGLKILASLHITADGK